MNNRRKHILVVDDEPLIHDMLKVSLELNNYRVSAVSNGLEALKVLSKKIVDIILMDIRMPVLDGIETVEFIRSCEGGGEPLNPEYPEIAGSLRSKIEQGRIPIVAVTGNIGDREAAIRAGMDDFITKPFDINQIYDLVERFTSGKNIKLASERRQHPRYVINDNSVLICGDKIGQVMDISSGGLAVRYTNYDLAVDEWSVTFHNTIKKISTNTIPLKLMRKGVVNYSSTSSIRTQEIGAMFNCLDEMQQQQIDEFINYIVE